jgi:hypothetical protein
LHTESHGTIVEHGSTMDDAATGDDKMNPRRSLCAFASIGLALVLAAPGNVGAQEQGNWQAHVSTLQSEHPDVYDLVLRLERIHGVLFGELAAEGEAVRASPEKLPSPSFEFDMLDRLAPMASESGTLEDVAAEAEAGYAVLGERAAAIIQWTNDFRLEVLGILADPTLTAYPERRAAVAAAVERYKSRPEAALPSEPKNMDVLYDHAQALAFRTGYTDLDGLVWAGHWLKLAVTEPLTDLSGDQRFAGLDTVQTRYYAKLTYGEPPEFFPSELPLAPAIAAGFSFLSPEAAIVFDNLSMMEEVLADILVSPNTVDARAALDETVEFFMDPTVGMSDRILWGTMALRHGIFFQGGYPLAVMTKSELNVGGHIAHLRGGAIMPMPGM